jgi:hypothetical protein
MQLTDVHVLTVADKLVELPLQYSIGFTHSRMCNRYWIASASVCNVPIHWY